VRHSEANSQPRCTRKGTHGIHFIVPMQLQEGGRIRMWDGGRKGEAPLRRQGAGRLMLVKYLQTEASNEKGSFEKRAGPREREG
jgi:hypothetical protein